MFEIYSTLVGIMFFFFISLVGTYVVGTTEIFDCETNLSGSGGWWFKSKSSHKIHRLSCLTQLTVLWLCYLLHISSIPSSPFYNYLLYTLSLSTSFTLSLSLSSSLFLSLSIYLFLPLFHFISPSFSLKHSSFSLSPSPSHILHLISLFSLILFCLQYHTCSWNEN
jgi:hypothetical protein